MKPTLTVLVLVAVVMAGGMYYANQLAGEAGPGFRVTTLKRADLFPTIAATGTLEPEEIVDVGAQVVGRIKDFGIDPSDPQKKKRIDYGSTVHEGTELAYIDDELYQAQVGQTQALLHRAKADLLQWEAKLDQSKLDLKRSESLVKLQAVPGSSRPIKGISESDYETSVMNQKVGAANVALAKANIAQQEAALQMVKTNLKYTVIRSPIEGTIIARRVNIGQTVVASLSAPSLFLLAKDLSKIQVWAAVNEADVGRIQPDMPVRFTVDAFPTEVFRGTVLQIRDNAVSTQNVVTYTVVVTTDNANKKLRPFFTANLQFEIDQRHDVLAVPNAALRWKPKAAQIAPNFRGASATEKDDAKRPSRGNAGAVDPRPPRPLKPKSDRGKLWVKDGDFVRPIEVHVGVNDGVSTEVSGDELKEGLEIVIGEARKDSRADDVTNPFAPKRLGGKRG